MTSWRRAQIAALADNVEEQWRFYGFCNTLEQARYIATQGLSAGLSEPSQSWRLSSMQCEMVQATWMPLLRPSSQQPCRRAGLSALVDACLPCCRHPSEVSWAESQDAARGLLGQLDGPAAQVLHAGAGLPLQWQHGLCCCPTGRSSALLMTHIMQSRVAQMGVETWPERSPPLPGALRGWL